MLRIIKNKKQNQINNISSYTYKTIINIFKITRQSLIGKIKNINRNNNYKNMLVNKIQLIHINKKTNG